MNSNLAVSRNDCGRVLESDPSLFDEGVTKSKSSFLLVFTNILCEFIHYKYCTSVQTRLMKGKTRSPVGWTVSWCKRDETVLWIKLYRLCTFWHVFMTGKLFSCAVRRIESAYTTRCKSIVLCNLEWTWTHRHTQTHTCWLAAYQRISECFMNLRHWWWKRLDVWRKTDIKCLVLLSVFTSPLKRVELWSAWVPRPNRCYKVTFGTHKMVDSGWTFSGGFNSPLFAKQASWHHVLDARTNG